MTLLALDPGREGFGWAWFDTHRCMRACGVVPQPKAAADYTQASIEAVAAQVEFQIRVELCARVQSWWCPERVVVERMRVYPPKRRPPGARAPRNPVGELVAKANDLLDLQGIAGMVARGFAGSSAIKTRFAADWKGSTDTEVIERRLRAGTISTLTAWGGELGLIDAVRPAGLRHNAIDAYVMGGVELGRFRLR